MMRKTIYDDCYLIGEYIQDCNKRYLIEEGGYVEIARRQTTFYRARWKNTVFMATGGKFRGCLYTIEPANINGYRWNGMRVYYAPKILAEAYKKMLAEEN